jgi:hypothetical protein
MTLQQGEQKRIQKAIAQKIYNLESNSDRRAKLFKAIHVDLKERFRVVSYKDIRRSEMQTVLRYIETWKPRMVS